jgi:hypothetical protein
VLTCKRNGLYKKKTFRTLFKIWYFTLLHTQVSHIPSSSRRKICKNDILQRRPIYLYGNSRDVYTYKIYQFQSIYVKSSVPDPDPPDQHVFGP